MISTPDLQRAIALIEDARAQGARLEAACRGAGHHRPNVPTLDARRRATRGPAPFGRPAGAG